MENVVKLKNLRPGNVVSNEGCTGTISGVITAIDREWITYYDLEDSSNGKMCSPRSKKADKNTVYIVGYPENIKVIDKILSDQYKLLNDIRRNIEELKLIKTLKGDFDEQI